MAMPMSDDRGRQIVISTSDGGQKPVGRDSCRGATELGLPSIAAQAASLTKATAPHVFGGMKIASEEVAERRWATCFACDKILNDRCTVCGCFMKV